MTSETMQALIERARGETTTYPQYATRLAEGGIESYHVDVAAHTIDWQGRAGTYHEAAPAVIADPTAAAPFSQRDLVHAIRRNQRGETDYPGFLREIWAAGVCGYDADLRARTVAYRGAGGEEYVEAIPPIA